MKIKAGIFTGPVYDKSKSYLVYVDNEEQFLQSDFYQEVINRFVRKQTYSIITSQHSPVIWIIPSGWVTVSFMPLNAHGVMYCDTKFHNFEKVFYEN